MNVSMERILSLPKPLVMGLALALTLLIGSLDFITGRDFALSAFYLLPICWVCWVAGRRAGIFAALASTAIWFISDLVSGFVYRHRLTPYWNALMLFVLFVVVVCLLSAFQTAHYHLEEIVQRRTAALEAEIRERKRLEAAKLQAERLAMVGSMAAQVAHEIRNPLGSITLNLDLIYKEIEKLAGGNGHLPDEGRSLVKDIREEAHRIQRVIEDYLQFARLPKLQRCPVALNAFLDQKLAFLFAEVERTNVKLHTHFDPALTTINADAEQLWQTALNLIRNGCEAMPEGGDLTVGTWRDGQCALVRISDSGTGMTPEQLSRLFEPFFTTKTDGTGLGLALAQQIVTEHGGHIECESAVDKGATFTISLPLAEKS
ncbi:MAG TPA: ATP-binding protein [Candidatus Baltobacteraceae bacterium]|jgi:signal transduction histidine kinase|nr:ATP-binding protein [Candidatus Baltobacteraceae bacterium]